MDRQPAKKKAAIRFLNFLLIGIGLICFLIALVMVGLPILFAVVYAYEKLTLPSKVRPFIPAKVVIEKVLSNEGYMDVKTRASCASVSFQLSDKTAAEIEKSGVAFFDDIQMTESFFLDEFVEEKWIKWRKQEGHPKSLDIYRQSEECTLILVHYIEKNNIQLSDRYSTSEIASEGSYATIDIYPKEKIVVFRYNSF